MVTLRRGADPRRRFPTLDSRFALPIATGLVVLAIAETLVGGLMFGWFRAPGVDLDIYLGATARLLAGDGWFLSRQLSGPYSLSMGDVLYPPISVGLFGPFLVLPRVLWWVIPIAATLVAVLRWRPGPWAWVGIALCLLWPYTTAKIITGNPAMWLMMFVALGLRFRWLSALVFFKPSLFPFGLIGIRDRSWWLTAGVLGLGSLVFAAESLTWFRVIWDATGGGPLYSIVDVPTVLIPVLAWTPSPARSSDDVHDTDLRYESVPSTSGVAPRGAGP